MRKIITLLLCFMLSTAVVLSASSDDISPQDAERALAAVFVFGDTFGWMGCGFVIGDGSWVVTTADLITESFGSDAKVDVKRVTVLSGWTGDAYEGEVKIVDRKMNLAVIKLPVKGLPSVPLAGPESFKAARTASLGQILSGDQVGAKWDTWIYALGGKIDDKQGSQLALKKWQGRGSVVVQNKSVNWLFLSSIEPEDNAPRASLVWRERGGVVGLYNGRLIVEGSKKQATYSQCLTSTEIIKALKAAGLDADTLTKAQKPTLQPDKVADKSLQSIWATLSNVVLGKWTDAQKSAKVLVELRPESSLAHLLLGIAQAGGGKAEEGVKSMDKAISLDDSTPGAYYSRGIAQASLNKPEEAEADFKKAVAKNPSDYRPLVALAELQAADKNRLAEAEQSARKAVNIDPQRPGPRLTLALILKSRRSYDDAVAELKAALKTAPEWGMAKAALAATLEAAGNTAEAEIMYRNLAKTQPNNPDALFVLASFLADHGKKEEALKVTADLLAMKLPKEFETAVKELEKKLQPGGSE